MIGHDTSWYVMQCQQPFDLSVAYLFYRKPFCSIDSVCLWFSLSMWSFAIEDAPSPFPVLYTTLHCFWISSDAGDVRICYGAGTSRWEFVFLPQLFWSRHITPQPGTPFKSRCDCCKIFGSSHRRTMELSLSLECEWDLASLDKHEWGQRDIIIVT